MRGLRGAWRRWWRAAPRLALEDTAAPQLGRLLPIREDERVLVVGPDAEAMAAVIAPERGAALVPEADAEEFGGGSWGVDLLVGEVERIPVADGAFSVIVVPHRARHWSDRGLERAMGEFWRVLGHDGVVVLWEIAPSRARWVNRGWGLLLGRGARLRTFAELGRAAHGAGFAWIQTAPLPPFLWPPGPRAGVLARKESYE